VSSGAGYLADTSVFVAVEQRRQLGPPPPGDARVSVATLTELRLGVLRAPTPEVLAFREATFASARRFIALPYDEAVAAQLAALLARARPSDRRARTMDAIVAATALVHDLVVWAQDEDFNVFSALEPALRVQRG
jgi:predicted nucleic acid-binding protein